MEVAGSPSSPYFDEMRRQTIPPQALLLRRMEGLLLSVMGELRAGAETGDEEAVRRAAHKLKGSCQNVGAGFMAKLAAKIERTSTAGQFELDGLDRVFADTRDALRSALLEGDA